VFQLSCIGHIFSEITKSVALKREGGSIGFKQIRDRLFARLYTRYPALVKNWARKARIMHSSDIPWTPFQGKIEESRLALITTGGVHLKSQPSFDMLDPGGDPSFRQIPADAIPDQLVITHNYYDHRDANRDVNIIFPLEGARQLKALNEIGAVNYRHFSFMGHILDQHIETLINDTAPRVAAALKNDSVDIVVLTPA
jgi:D-proline reductase (dithiol) PrdB